MTKAKRPSKTRPYGSVLEQATLLDHDIRNAIADALSGLEQAEHSLTSHGSQSALEKARLSVQQLARLSQSALELATGEAMMVSPAEAAIDTQAFLNALQARFSGQSDPLVLHRDAALPPLLRLSPNLLERALVNLLSNAFKYGAGQPVTLEVAVSPTKDLVFTVADQGPGFSAAARAKLFAFSGRDADADKAGSGHGLHIANSVTRDLGGRLTLADPDTPGATLVLTLPENAWGAGYEDSVTLDLSGKLVLIAEDSPTLQAAMRRMIQTLGADTLIAEDGVTALQLVQDHPIDLALIDIEMPRMSGLELLGAMRALDAPMRHIPTLAVTAYARVQCQHQIFEAGADGILVKPVLSLATLASAIEDILNTGAAPAETDPSIDGLDITALDRLLAFGSEGQGKDLLFRLIADIENVAETLETALTNNDFPAIRSAAHILVALSGAVGAKQVQNIADRLNSAAQGTTLQTTAPLCRAALAGASRLSKELRAENLRRFGADQ